MSVIFLRLTGDLPSLAAMQAFLDESYVLNDDDMECWEEHDSRLLLPFKSGDIDFLHYRNDENLFRLTSKSTKLVYQLGYFLAVTASGTLSFTKDGEFFDVKNLEPLLKELFSVEESFERVEKLKFLLPDFFNKNFEFIKNKVTEKLYRFNCSENGRRVQGACSDMNMPLMNWVGKGGNSVLDFKLNNSIKSDFFAFVLVSYTTQEWFFVMWQIEGRRFWYGVRNFGVYHGVDFDNVKNELEELIQMWDLEGESVFYFDGDFI